MSLYMNQENYFLGPSSLCRLCRSRGTQVYNRTFVVRDSFISSEKHLRQLRHCHHPFYVLLESRSTLRDY